MDGCRWIDGDPRDGGKACGRETVDGVWCNEHRRIVYPEPGTPAYCQAEGAMMLAAKNGGKETSYFIAADFERMSTGAGCASRRERARKGKRRRVCRTA